MGNRRRCILWAGVILLVALLATVYVAVDAIYSDVTPVFSEGYVEYALTNEESSADQS